MVKLYKYIALLWLMAACGKEGYATTQESDEKTKRVAQALENLKIVFNERDTEKLLERIEAIQGPKERLSAINPDDEAQQEFLKAKITEAVNKKIKINKQAQSYLTPGELIEKHFERKARFQVISDDLEETEKQFCTLKMQSLSDDLNKNDLEAVSEFIQFYRLIESDLQKYIDIETLKKIYDKATEVLSQHKKQDTENAAEKLQEIQKSITQMHVASERKSIGTSSLGEGDPKLQKNKGKKKVDVLPKNREVQEEREGIVLEKEADDSLSVEIKTRNKALIASKEPGIFKVGNRNNVDSYLKITFAPNLLPLMKKKFIGFDASNTDITGKGLAYVPKTFKTLNLENCHQITDEALKTIGQFEALEALNLEGCSTTIKTLEELKKVYPGKEEAEESPLKSISEPEVSSSIFKPFDPGEIQEEKGQRLTGVEDKG